MAAIKRFKTKYPGVFYREVERIGASGTEHIYPIVFKKDGKVLGEKAGRQYADDMTPAKAAGIRAERVEGKRISRKELQQVRERERQRPTIARLWSVYLEGRPQNGNTAIDDGRFRKYLQERFGDKLTEEIGTNDIRTYKNQLLRDGNSPQSVLNILALLRRIIRFGSKNGLCEMPPVSKLHFEMPTVDNLKTESLTPEQLVALKQALDEESDQNAAAIMRLALVTGMRKGAILALRWEDIDFDKNFITLQGVSAKKGRTERIPLTQAAREIVRYIEHGESPYLFPGKNGGHRTEFRLLPQRVKKKAGLPDDFRPLHGLRHAYASFLASSGKVDLYTLQKLLTHSSPQMTQRYAHLADESILRAANVMDEIIKNNGNPW